MKVAQEIFIDGVPLGLGAGTYVGATVDTSVVAGGTCRITITMQGVMHLHGRGPHTHELLPGGRLGPARYPSKEST